MIVGNSQISLGSPNFFSIFFYFFFVLHFFRFRLMFSIKLTKKKNIVLHAGVFFQLVINSVEIVCACGNGRSTFPFLRDEYSYKKMKNHHIRKIQSYFWNLSLTSR